MKKYILFAALFLTSCATLNYNNQNIVKKSFYLNKPLVKFEMDNGYCYYRKKINGGYLNYYKSSSGNILANLLTWDSYPDCELEIKTNNKGVITQIKILQDDIKCAYILR